MFFGVDPDKAFDLIDLDFRAGNARQAKEMLKKGRHLIVTEEFRKLKGLTLGDKLPLRTARHGVVDYTIAGVVWSPGIDVIVGIFDLGRQFEQRTVASVFGSIDDAREDFGVSGVYIFAANLDYFVQKEKVLEDVKKALGSYGLDAGDVRQIKAGIQSAFGNLLLLVSSVAFAAMAVSSLGVTNAMMASVRSRRWQFGILRSIGVTRSQLLRLVMAEAVLLGIVGCGLGLAAGAEMSVNARQLSLITLGLAWPTVVPWKMIIFGIVVIMLVAVGASAWPAINVARKEPLTLLQSGRAAA
jgi:putative ABC transport system permease protein